MTWMLEGFVVLVRSKKMAAAGLVSPRRPEWGLAALILDPKRLEEDVLLRMPLPGDRIERVDRLGDQVA